MRPDELAFRARALAQAHPMSAEAARVRDGLVRRDAARQTMTELSQWAATAALTGYCVRRVEETESGCVRPAVATTPIDEHEVARVADAMRTGRSVTLLDDAVVVGSLDLVIASEIAKRVDNVREAISAQEWAQFEEYVAWWVVHGYALRAVEAGVRSEDHRKPEHGGG